MIHWQPTGRRARDQGQGEIGGRLIVRYGWNGYVPPPPPPLRHRMDELLRRNQSWLATQMEGGHQFNHQQTSILVHIIGGSV